MARYTLIVGTRNWSSWSLRPYVALKATGAPFEVIDIRLRQTEAPTTREQILNYSPAGKVPVLKIGEGAQTLTVWDSLAICETLA
jgi:glutathione S-transferase